MLIVVDPPRFGNGLRVVDRANSKFRRRFAGIERAATERGMVLGEATLEELDGLWDEVKNGER